MNKKLLATLMMSTLAVSAFAANAGATSDKQVLKDEKGKVHNVIGHLGKVTGASAEERAINALEKAGSDFGIDKAAGKFKVKESHLDENGTTHTKLTHVIGGIPVFNEEMIVHEKGGNVSGVTGDYTALTPNTTTATLTADDAIAKAVASTGYTGKLSRPATTELAYVAQGDTAILTYKTSVSYTGDNPARLMIFVNAVDGSIVNSFNALTHYTMTTGTGTGVLGDTKSINTSLYTSTYYLEDHTKTGMVADGIQTYDMRNGTTTGYYFTDTDNVWNTTTQRAGVDAHYYAGKVYDYYKSIGRNSYDNAGGALYSYVHYSTGYNNAYWDGTEMVYGDGDGVQFRSLSGGYDVVAHELTHAVTERTSGLTYSSSADSGALNESWSDAQACVMDSNDWLIGEDVYTPGTAGDALRSLSNPPLYGQADHMSGYVAGNSHINEGIPNKAFYNYATGIGSRTTAGKVWYVASRDYMTSSMTFSGARAATIQAEMALYGTSSVANAWSMVGVY